MVCKRTQKPSNSGWETWPALKNPLVFLIHSSVFNPRLDQYAGLPLRTGELLKPEFNYAACMVHFQLSSHEMPVCQICLSSCAFNRCLFLSKLGRRWEENRAYELGNALYMAITIPASIPKPFVLPFSSTFHYWQWLLTPPPRIIQSLTTEFGIVIDVGPQPGFGTLLLYIAISITIMLGQSAIMWFPTINSC